MYVLVPSKYINCIFRIHIFKHHVLVCIVILFLSMIEHGFIMSCHLVFNFILWQYLCRHIFEAKSYTKKFSAFRNQEGKNRGPQSEPSKPQFDKYNKVAYLINQLFMFTAMRLFSCAVQCSLQLIF